MQERIKHTRQEKVKTKVRFVSVARKETRKHCSKVKSEFTLLPQISRAFLTMRKRALHRRLRNSTRAFPYGNSRHPGTASRLKNENVRDHRAHVRKFASLFTWRNNVRIQLGYCDTTTAAARGLHIASSASFVIRNLTRCGGRTRRARAESVGGFDHRRGNVPALSHSDDEFP